MGKSRQVGIKGRGAPEDFGVAHPTQTLVALRTIGGHAQKISTRSPEYIAPQLVHDGISRAELNGERRRGVEHYAFNCVLRGLSRVAGKFDVAEYVEGKVRFKRFASLPAQDIGIGGFSRTQVFRIELAIRLEHFAEAQPDFRSSFAGNVQSRPTNHVLAEIEDIDSWRGIGNAFGLEDFVDTDGLEILCDQRSLRRRSRDCSPAQVGERGLIPSS